MGCSPPGCSLDLACRGLDIQGVLLVVDGAKAQGLCRSRRVRHPGAGPAASTPQGAQRRLPSARVRTPWVRRKLHVAWACDDADAADGELEDLPKSLQRKRPGAAASLRERLAETMIVNRLGVGGKLLQPVEATNPVKRMIETLIWHAHARRVKRRRDGDTALRWAAAGMLAAEAHFNRVKGYRQLPNSSRPQPRLSPAVPTPMRSHPPNKMHTAGGPASTSENYGTSSTVAGALLPPRGPPAKLNDKPYILLACRQGIDEIRRSGGHGP